MAELTIDENQDDDGDSFGEVSEREPAEDAGSDDDVSTVKTEESAKAEEKSTEEPTEETESEETEEVTEEKSTEGTSKEKTEVAPEEPKLTEKGTKLDPNPESAVHQQLANERAKTKAMESVMRDPEKLNKYMQDSFPKKEEAPARKVFKAEDFASIDDVANKFNDMQSEFDSKTQAQEAEIKALKGEQNRMQNNTRYERVANIMEQDITSLRQEKELNPKSPDYIEGLENDIASAYHKLDFDERTGEYRGKQSMADVGKQMISVARKARQKGSVDAQTVVKDKSAGKVVTSPKVKDEVNTDNLSAGDSIAAGISKTFR